MDEQTITAMLEAQECHQRALAAAQGASEARSVAVARAHRAGASYRALARVLGMSGPMVVKLVKLGERALAKEEALS